MPGEPHSPILPIYPASVRYVHPPDAYLANDAVEKIARGSAEPVQQGADVRRRQRIEGPDAAQATPKHFKLKPSATRPEEAADLQDLKTTLLVRVAKGPVLGSAGPAKSQALDVSQPASFPPVKLVDRGACGSAIAATRTLVKGRVRRAKRNRLGRAG